MNNTNTNERRVLEKIVNSRLYVVMAVAFTLYTLFSAMTVVLNFYYSSTLDIINIILTVFGALLSWRVWSLYMNATSRSADSSTVEKMTGFFTCQKVICMITAVLLALALFVLLAIIPYMGVAGDILEKILTEDVSLYDVILEFSVNEDQAKEIYNELIVTESITDEEFTQMREDVRDALYGNENVASFLEKAGLAKMFKFAVIILMAFVAFVAVIFLLFSFYMKRAARFVNDFCITWNGYAPWPRGVGYLSGLGYFLSVILFISALTGIFNLPNDISVLTDICAAVSLLCFAKFTVKTDRIMDELYKLNI